MMLSTASGSRRTFSSSALVAVKIASADPKRSRSLAAALGPMPGVIFNATQSLIADFRLPIAD
jgi:hypothetical protein